MRTPSLTLLLLLIFSLPASATDDPPSDIDHHRWAHRVILMHATSGGEDAIGLMRDRLRSAEDGLVERDLVVYDVPRGHPLVKMWSLDGDFTLVLIGKDGTEKLRRRNAVELSAVFELVGSMPLRQREMRERDAD